MGENFQASHVPLKTTPMPHEEEASTQNSTDEGGGGFDNNEPQKGKRSWDLHQLMSVRTLGLGDLRMKGDDKKLKEAAKREMAGRRERPSGKAREQWTRVPRRDSTSFCKNLWPGVHGSSLERYRVFLAGGIWTVLAERSQIKPRYLNCGAKGLVFDSFQGQPSCAAR